jgi:hypothetical protein
MAAFDSEVGYGSGGRRRYGSWRGRRLRCRRPARMMGGSEAVETLDEAAAVPRGAAARRAHRAEEQRCGWGRRLASEALGRHGSAVTCVEGRRREVRRRPARRRTWQRGAAYRTEATMTSGRSCQNGGEAGEASDRGCRGGRARRCKRSVSDSRSGRLYTRANGIG